MRTVLIGAGAIGREHLLCLSRLENAEVLGVCDISPALAESTAERFALPRWFVDHRRMLEELRPDVVHVTTPCTSHFRLAMDALDAGSHVIVEKPITTDFAELDRLCDRAGQVGRRVVEDHNYLFQRTVQQILDFVRSGQLGEVVHVEVAMCVDILGEGSRFADPNLPHPSLSLPGGAIADFATHLAYLADAFIGPYRTVQRLRSTRDAKRSLPSDELRALVEGERGTASIVFSAHARPEAFWIRVFGTRMRAEAQLWEPRLVLERFRPGAGALTPLLNGLSMARAARRGAWRGLLGKLGGRPGSYEGLWDFLRQTYRALESGEEPPVSTARIRSVSRLVGELLVAGDAT